MDILIHSLLDKVRKFNTALHIRYYAQAQSTGRTIPPDAQQRRPHTPEGSKPMTSYVIIHREYSYLEPLVRSMFEDAEDVTVLIDRRSEDRDGPRRSSEGDEQKGAANRRASNPMLDILINVE
jgi:hypothetical protein